MKGESILRRAYTDTTRRLKYPVIQALLAVVVVACAAAGAVVPEDGSTAMRFGLLLAAGVAGIALVPLGVFLWSLAWAPSSLRKERPRLTVEPQVTPEPDPKWEIDRASLRVCNEAKNKAATAHKVTARVNLSDIAGTELMARAVANFDGASVFDLKPGGEVSLYVAHKWRQVNALYSVEGKLEEPPNDETGPNLLEGDAFDVAVKIEARELREAVTANYRLAIIGGELSFKSVDDGASSAS